MKKVFKSDELEAWGLPYADPPGGRIVSDRIVDHRRWTVRHELIFRLADQPVGEAWLMHYDSPATEYQAGGVDRWDDEVTATLVRSVEKVVTMWEPVEDARD